MPNSPTPSPIPASSDHPCPSEASALICCDALRPAQLHFAVADERDAVRAAAAYEQELRAHFNLKAGQLPQFDLIVTGTGNAQPVADEYSRIAVARYSAAARRSYVTLTDPVLRARIGHLWRRVPLDLADVADVDAVLLSHVHYDHLDRPSLRQLGTDVTLVVPRSAGRAAAPPAAVASPPGVSMPTWRGGHPYHTGPLSRETPWPARLATS